MATYVKGNEVENAETYELFEKVGDEYNSLATATEINFDVSALGLEAGDHALVVKAKTTKEGYEDSDYSNEVVYTIADEWVDITDRFVFTDGKVVNATQTGVVTSYDGWAATEELVDVSDCSELEIKMSKTSSTGTSSGLAIFDAEQNYVRGIVHTDGQATYGTMIKNIVLADNEHYIRTMYWDKASANYKEEYGDFYCKAKLRN